ncbi:hypothetical protein CASFOL_003008 [Castilleja foliolosa]|uniref:Aminotransferase-like plant mobile domain-containing protein n=2 Tax=Magnoliopsida TaxID=3398 RepID=A0ABD3EFZ3_9LAMI
MDRSNPENVYRRTRKRPTRSERARRRNEPEQEQEPVPLPEPLALPMSYSGAWIYERFPCFRAAINVNYEVGQPLAYRWTTSRNAGPSVAHLQAHRETLDLMSADQVIWCPYGQDVRAHYPFSEVSFYSGYLSAHDVVEPYYPERVLRQFGYIQTIPRDPVELSRTDSRAKAFLNAQFTLQFILGSLGTLQNFNKILTMKNNERLANLALAGLTLAPLVVQVDPNLNVILTACLTVYVGCYRSVKPTPPSLVSNRFMEYYIPLGRETMSNEHAMRFPLVGSAMLLSLFLLFKFLSKDLVNAVLTAYFFVLGIVALSATLLPAIKRYLPQPWNDNVIVWRFPYIRALVVEFTKSQIIAAIPGFFFCAWYASKKHWLANNILGLAFCIQGIEMLSLGSFKTGAILLSGLFVYDIFWVFFTPVMVSVAKSFDAPIKLLFPTSNSARPFSMLGLGDIVIPGIFVALALRFDVSRGTKSKYFNSAFVGYTVGVVLTIIVMNWFQAAQPALLYIVPAVIGFLAAHCLWNGHVKSLLEFDETKKTGSEETNDSDKKEE